MTLSVFDAGHEQPDKIGLIVDDEEYSFADLADMTTEAVVDVCDDLLPDPTTKVALTGDTRLETIIKLYALLELRIPVVMIHPDLTEAEKDTVLSQMKPAVLWDDEARWFEWDGAPSTPDECAVIITTSGTSGCRRGVMLSQRNLMASGWASGANLGWFNDDRWLLNMPTAHVGGLSIVTRCLLERSAIVCSASTSADDIRNHLDADRVTQLSLVPTVLKRVLDLGGSWRAPDHLRFALVGGAPVSDDLLEAARELGVRALRTYGLTETSSQICTQRLESIETEIGCGKPLDGFEVSVREDEIFVRSEAVTCGYFPPESEETVVDAGGWLGTGDKGVLCDDGSLIVMARSGDVIISGGENVFPPEIEDVLSQVVWVDNACVFGVPDDDWGELVCGALTLKEGCEAVWSELESHVHKNLAQFKRPRMWCLLPTIPLAASKKVDREEVKRLAFPLLSRLEDFQ
jgi:O-succinylbenzoic acid--CoA ligase